VRITLATKSLIATLHLFFPSLLLVYVCAWGFACGTVYTIWHHFVYDLRHISYVYFVCYEHFGLRTHDVWVLRLRALGSMLAGSLEWMNCTRVVWGSAAGR
jgi:hypothetical protein